MVSNLPLIPNKPPHQASSKFQSHLDSNGKMTSCNFSSILWLFSFRNQTLRPLLPRVDVQVHKRQSLEGKYALNQGAYRRVSGVAQILIVHLCSTHRNYIILLAITHNFATENINSVNSMLYSQVEMNQCKSEC